MLVPLCGKSVDMRWLLDAGHSVVGVDVAAQPLDEFMSALGVPYSTTRVSDELVVRETEDGRVRLLECDMLGAALCGESVGPVTAVWDRAAMVALHPSQRAAYGAKVLSLLQPGAHMLMETVEYEQSLMQGPPFSLTEEAVRRTFGTRFAEFRHMNTVRMPAQQRRWGLPWLHAKVLLMRNLKSD